MTTKGDALTVLEAARELGVTPDALRARVKRGSVEAFKGDDGRTWLLRRETVDTLAAELLSNAGQTPAGRADLSASLARAEATAETLASEVAYLRDQLSLMQGEREAEYRRHAGAIEAERARLYEAIGAAQDERTRMLAILANMAPMLTDGDAGSPRSEDDRRGASPWSRMFGRGR